MSNLPANVTKTASRKRIIINASGEMWTTWYKVFADGTLWIDPQGHGQYKAGTWRYIIERETKTITYSEA